MLCRLNSVNHVNDEKVSNLQVCVLSDVWGDGHNNMVGSRARRQTLHIIQTVVALFISVTKYTGLLRRGSGKMLNQILLR